MTYRDELLTCETCGKAFIYRVEEQRHQEDLGFEPEMPQYCADCRQSDVAGPGLRAGVVKWFREDKHFGFITQRDGSDVFFHMSGVEGDLVQVMQENAPVWYEVITTERGPQAINVHSRE